MIKTFIINLKKYTDRCENMEKLLKGSNLEIHRFEAIYGKDMTETEIEENTSFICRNISCSYGVMGCAMSHITLWKKLLNEKDNNFLILEDDIEKIDFDKLYKLINNLDTFDWDIISLHILQKINQKVIKEIDDIKIANSLIPMTTAGYLINKNGLRKMVDIINEQKIILHVDIQMLILKYLKGIKYYNTIPNIVIASQNDSTINHIVNTPIKKILKKFNLDFLVWHLSAPMLAIRLKYQITLYHILLIILFILNIKFFKSIIIAIILIIEFIFLVIDLKI
jgi:GR25 family glycosyltransferase involved in LPS biosynthesis